MPGHGSHRHSLSCCQPDRHGESNALLIEARAKIDSLRGAYAAAQDDIGRLEASKKRVSAECEALQVSVPLPRDLFLAFSKGIRPFVEHPANYLFGIQTTIDTLKEEHKEVQQELASTKRQLVLLEKKHKQLFLQVKLNSLLIHCGR